MAAENVLNITYNEIEVRCSRLLSWERTPILHGPDVLYVRHRIHMWGTVHHLFSWRGPAVQSEAIPKTDNFCLQKLQVPRKKLTITLSGGSDVLGLPAAQQDEKWLEIPGVDLDKGPLVVGSRLSAFIGPKQLSHEMVFEFVDRRPVNDKKPPPIILSNRWTMVEGFDRYFRKTVTVHGRAIFRRDRLQAGDLVPDQFRAWLLWPVAKGYRRAHQEVGTGIDGVELFYTTVDEQTSVDIRAKELADIQVIHTYGTSRVAPGQTWEKIGVGLGGAAVNAANAGEDAYRGARGKYGVKASRAVAASARGASAVGSAISAGSQIYSDLPQYYSNLTVWLKGTPHANMAILYAIGDAVVNQRRALYPLVSPAETAEYQANFTTKELTITTTGRAAPVQQNVKMIAGKGGGENFFSNEVHANAGENSVSTRHHEKDLNIPGQSHRGEGTPANVVAKALGQFALICPNLAVQGAVTGGANP